MSEILVKEYRGPLVENVHKGDIAIVTKEDKVDSYCGNIEKVVYYRSTAKPLQVLPVITSGAANHFKFTDKEIALMAASHSGEKIHTDILKDILNKIELNIDDLKCGTHPPFDRKTRNYLRKNNKKVTPAHHACSGKHASQLALAKYFNWDLKNYYKKEHPVQKLLLETIAEVTNYPASKIVQGKDGCGVVVFGLPLKYIAYSYSLMNNHEALPDKYSNAAQKIVKAMKKYPKIVAGTNRFANKLNNAIKRDLLIKSGADGVFAFAFDEKGIAIKIEDGSLKSTYPVVIEILKSYNIISDKEVENLIKYYRPTIKDSNGDIVGQINTDYELQYTK
ncbi:MAG TPA: asparaginase [Halanaerobiales bacterium]|nr:asparaginase [Halanaerobiales bacterium]